MLFQAVKYESGHLVISSGSHVESVHPVESPLLLRQGAKRQTVPQVHPQSRATRLGGVGLECLVNLGLFSPVVLVPRLQLVEVLREGQGQGPGPAPLGSLVESEKRRNKILTRKTRANVVRPAQNDDPVLRLRSIVQDLVQTVVHGRKDALSRHASRVDLRAAVAMFP